MATLYILVATTFTTLLLAVASSIYQITTTAAPANPKHHEEQDCRQQFEQQEKMLNCQDFIREKSQTQSQRPMRYTLAGCCNQLLFIKSGCRCDALEIAAREQGGGEVQLTQKAMRVAREIPFMCDITPGRCQFGNSMMTPLRR